MRRGRSAGSWRRSSEGFPDEDLGRRLEKMAGFRNVLAHGYAEVVPERVHQTLAELDDIRSYVQALGSHLTDEGVLPGSG